MKPTFCLLTVIGSVALVAALLPFPAVSEDDVPEAKAATTSAAKGGDQEKATANDADEAQEPQKDVNVWMRQKAVLSQKVMDGLTHGDFEKIQNGAVLMNVLSYFENRAHSNQPDYKRHLTQFDFANRELIRMARQKNLEGATLAYNQLTVSCVYCHKTLRDAEKQ